MKYEIEGRDESGRWDRDVVGQQLPFDSETEAQASIPELARHMAENLGWSGSESDLRVVGVPERPCPRCYGAGQLPIRKHENERPKRCPDCNGSGEIH